MEALRYQKSIIKTGWIEVRADGRAEGIRSIARNMKEQGMTSENIKVYFGNYQM